MNVDTKLLYEALINLCEEKNLQVALSESLKGGILTGASAGVAGLMLGPVGLAIGGVVGGLLAAFSSKKFKPVATVMKEMPPERRVMLCNKVKDAFKHVRPEDVTALALMCLHQDSFRNIALREISNFLREEMNLRILPA